MILLNGLGYGGPLVTMGLGLFLSETEPDTTPSQIGGGFGYRYTRKKRTKEEIRAERIAYGILKKPKALEAVEQVAIAVIEAKAKPGLELKQNEQTEMLRNMLKDEGFQLKTEQNITRILNAAIAKEVEKLEEEQAIVQMLFDM